MPTFGPTAAAWLAAGLAAAVLLAHAPAATAPAARDARRIRPYRRNRRYWQLNGRPVLLLGGTVDDNLFQVPDLKAHLDELAAAGGNVVRNTMSDRPDKGYEVKAFGRRPDGRYDLTTWNRLYWRRFADLLRWTAERDIVVQIEVWDRFDHSRGPWKTDPFNPANNVNYTAAASGLKADYPRHPNDNRQPFFHTVPALRNNRVVLRHQQAFVDRMLSVSLGFDHVLYCMDNETSGSPEWGRYWARYIRRKAAAAGVAVETTEMWDDWDVTTRMHRRTLDHPRLYTFVDISQNSQTPGEPNWAHAQAVRAYLAKRPRPINSTKIYGAAKSKWRDRGIDADHAVATFWRNIVGGFASSRFHRPPSGLGLSAAAKAQLRSARLFAGAFDVFSAEPDAGHALLRDRSEDEAYCTRVPGRQYAVFFTDGGAVGLDLRARSGAFELKWLDTRRGRWGKPAVVKGARTVPLRPPGKGPWLALLTRRP